MNKGVDFNQSYQMELMLACDVWQSGWYLWPQEVSHSGNFVFINYLFPPVKLSDSFSLMVIPVNLEESPAPFMWQVYVSRLFFN